MKIFFISDGLLKNFFYAAQKFFLVDFLTRNILGGVSESDLDAKDH